MQESHRSAEQDGYARSADNDFGNDDNDDDAAEVQDYRGFAALIGGSGAGDAESAGRGRQQLNAQSIRRGEKDFEEHGTRAQQAALEQSRSVMESVLAYTRRSVGSETDAMRGWYFPDIWREVPDMAEREGAEAVREEDKEETAAGPTTNSRPKESRFTHIRERIVMVEAGRGIMFSSVGAVPGKRVLERRAGDGGDSREMQDGLGKRLPRKSPPGCDRVWLLPEEALFLVERGSMELWWPLQPLEEILAREEERREFAKQRKGDRAEEKESVADNGADADDEEGSGIPLSLEAAYALLIKGDSREGDNGESSNNEDGRGRISLPAYQVYTHLRRSGYHVLRAVRNYSDGNRGVHGQLPEATLATTTLASPRPAGLWPWLVSLLPNLVSWAAGSSFPGASFIFSRAQAERPALRPFGPLVRPGFYRSYAAVYAQLALGDGAEEGDKQKYPCDKEATGDGLFSPAPPPPSSSFRVLFHVWKAGSGFSKSRPPPPDFYLAVIDAHTTGVPTLTEMASLLNEVPVAARSCGSTENSPRPTEKVAGGQRQPAALGTVYRRLKQGCRSVVVGVVDHGVINYVQFTDGGRVSTFVEEPLWPRFDAAMAWRIDGRRKNDKAGKTGNSGKGRGKGNKKGKGKGKGKEGGRVPSDDAH